MDLLNEQLKLNIDKAISTGLEFLKRSQLPHGEFRTYMSSDIKMGKDVRYVSTIYTTTFILYSIDFIKNPSVDKIKEKALEFLIEEMEAQGIWRFYGTNRNVAFNNGDFITYTQFGIVPDLDDTACASYCLRKNNKIIFENSDLFYDNRSENGVFNTWLLNYPKHKEYTDQTNYIVPSKNDICCGVNANILFYLGENKDTIKACEYIIEAINTGYEKEVIPYFPNEIVLYYLVSRAYFEGVKLFEKTKKTIVEKLILLIGENHCFNGNLLYTGFVACVLMNFNTCNKILKDAILYIVNNQDETGHWTNESFFIDKLFYYYGSQDFTTAICLEAISRYCLLKGGELC